MDNIQEYIPIFLVCLASIILLQAIFRKNGSKFNLPPGPFALPVIGHFHLLKSPLHKAFQKISNHYGPLIHIYLGSTPIVVVSSAEIAQEIFKTHELSFSNRPPNVAISYLTYNSSDLAFAPYGTYWKFMKKLCMSELLNGKMLDQLLPIRQEEINRFLKMMQKKAEACEPVNVGDELLKLTNSIVMRMAISKSCFNSDDEAHKVTERIKESAMLSGKFNLADFFWFCKRFDMQGIGKRLQKVRDRFDTMIESIIQEHEEGRKKLTKKDAAKDVLDALLSIYEDQSSEVKITRDNIKAFLADMFSGGTDTTAVTLEWSLAELINHPTIMEKARKEIDSVIGKDKIVVESNIANFPYLQAIGKETLRLHPPAPFIMRESTENCIIAGYNIPAKTQVFTNVWVMGRDPKHWDKPLEFMPERFLSKDENGMKYQVEVRGQHYQLLPFGSGRRGCPGTSLALNIAHTTLAAMIQCFEWQGEEDGGNGGSVNMNEGPSFILSRAHPLICVPKARLVPFPSMPC
ncbi:cytochrome P450 93A3-like [Abrus precatorius]|uniref:Cytochrome P450 93A3-like n=1 Tax=Abrus precatorius TaxID=3816 RepID=A0A8B8MB41_ABRPR|nr:cytochrome P450 93A3-like [Abrus precatorius]